MIVSKFLHDQYRWWIIVFTFIIIGVLLTSRKDDDQLPLPFPTLAGPSKNVKHEITVVTGYFPLAKAKHSPSHYLSWLANLMESCQSPMIIFTSRQFYPTIYRLRRNGTLPSFFILDYESPSDMPPIRSLMSTFAAQHPTDPERSYHSIELYAVWCAKSFMLNHSATVNPFRSQWFFYMDAGAFRQPTYRFGHWPDMTKLKPFLNTDRYLLGMIDRLPGAFCPLRYRLSDGPLRLDLIEGTFMAGSIDTIRWWTSTYYSTIEEYRQKNFFIGKDQSVMNVIALANPNRLNMFLPFRLTCGDIWFAFGPFFARNDEQQIYSAWKNCHVQNISNYVIPFENVCLDRENLR